MTATLVIVLTFSLAASAQTGQPQAKPKATAAPVPKHDLSGVWQLQGTGGAESFAPETEMPPMTPWAKARFDAAKPGYGLRAAPGGNDPILQCDPIGIPRVLLMPTPYEFIHAPDRVLQFFEREHEWRPIWTDGRSLPKDPDPTWYGYAIGHWEGDSTFVVESTGYHDRSWITPTGYPHSEAMHVTERYHVSEGGKTLQVDLHVEDPEAFTTPWNAVQRYDRVQQGTLAEFPCAENNFDLGHLDPMPQALKPDF